MGKNPAFLFYPADWERDMGEHPLEIRGAWITICCALWWSETRGKSSKTLTNWSRVLGAGNKKSLTIIKYLNDAGIGDVDNSNGIITISSRRMLRDQNISEIRKRAALVGGDKTRNEFGRFAGKDVQQNIQQTSEQKSRSSVSVSVSKDKEKKPSDNLSSTNPNDGFFLNQETKNTLAQLLTKYPSFPAAKFIGIALNQKKHPDAILYALKETLTKCKGIDPGKYFLTILEQKSGNFYEDEHTKKSQEFKTDFAGIAEKLKEIRGKGS